MRRREFIAAVGGMATMPLPAHAQSLTTPIIGFISPNLSRQGALIFTAPFREGLIQVSLVDGRNVAIEEFHEGNRPDRLSFIAAELARRPVSLIMALGTVAALAAKAATKTVPVIFATGDDPIAIKLVTSFNRPGENLTGVTFFSTGVATKRLQLLHSLMPQVAVFGVLADDSPESQSQSHRLQEAAPTLGLQLTVATVGADEDVERTFALLTQQGAGAMIVASGPFLASRRDRVIALAARSAIPTLYGFRAFAAAGGLISYGASFASSMHQAGMYAGRILRGDKAGDLPIVQPTKFELVINLKTARELSIVLNPTLLALADEVIE
jgi:putative ABC transport system substrate-binding protein